MGVVVTGAGLALMRWAVTNRRPDARPPLPGGLPTRTPDEVSPADHDGERFDLRRPRDVLALAFIGIGVGCVLAFWVAGPVLHPIHLTVPLALMVVATMVSGAFSRDE